MNYQVVSLDKTPLSETFLYLNAALEAAWLLSFPGCPVNIVNVGSKMVVATVISCPEMG